MYTLSVHLPPTSDRSAWFLEYPSMLSVPRRPDHSAPSTARAFSEIHWRPRATIFCASARGAGFCKRALRDSPGLTLPDLLRVRAGEYQRIKQARRSQSGDPFLAFRGSEPDRHLGSQTRRANDHSRTLCDHSDHSARHSHLRALAAASPAHGQDLHSPGRRLLLAVVTPGHHAGAEVGAARRTNDGKDGGGYPSMGSVVAKFRGPNAPSMPAFVGLAESWKADVYGAGHMGSAFDPVKGNELPGRLAMRPGLSVARLQERSELRKQFDGLAQSLDADRNLEITDRYAEMAYDMVVSPAVRQAFDIAREPVQVRDAYGRCSVGEKALLARRLVEAGTSFVLVSGRWGYFDHHGDNVPPWGGIAKGLTPILPTIDRALTALIEDLEARGLLDSTLVLMMGEFGRSPVLTKDAGRDHWTAVMSMLMAGGGLRHGQVIGATDAQGGAIKNRRVRPADLAATVFRHLGVPLDARPDHPARQANSSGHRGRAGNSRRLA